ncbi:hypothetical protein AXE76_00020 [Gardnerella vaginalis]|uniref:Antitoxin SocA-like Panacea domain-containing protein n=2 Tax=Gardnerella vaginalis TaxID=2702 RepID=A0A3E1INS9_GARVA|nr:DUF4065 domain-containing protein [Bifidobacteriaceae bacterium NR043]MBF9353683.1 DUF4065 domain-containing protein [Bifidobacteriaceae bacterium NR044]RFD74659.1 hypothetical protein AXE76_00020 [Gardnerella vaginalis]RFT39673.1 hypothetical protein CG398_03680 [Bifidobacteriaceae bacterium NR003]
MITMTRAIDVAKYILEQREARNHMTTTFALQKLLYYVQAWMLVAQDRPLFDDPITAWKHGPVVKDIFKTYCKGRRYIFTREIPDGESSKVSREDRAVIDRVLSLYDNKDDKHLGDMLEQMSHEEEPWSKANLNDTITTDSMLAFYSMVQANEVESSAPVPNLADVSKRTFISSEDAQFLENLIAGE